VFEQIEMDFAAQVFQVSFVGNIQIHTPSRHHANQAFFFFRPPFGLFFAVAVVFSTLPSLAFVSLFTAVVFAFVVFFSGLHVAHSHFPRGERVRPMQRP
jgi:hypothetical protein